MRPGQVVMTHLHYRPEFGALLKDHEIHGILSVRDPRDVLLSNAAFIPKLSTHRLHEYAKTLEDPTALMLRLIQGNAEPRIHPMSDSLNAYADWIEAPVQVVRFEDLIGEQGGGNDHDQAATLRTLYDYLHLGVSDAGLERIRRQLFSAASPTFHRGTQ